MVNMGQQGLMMRQRRALWESGLFRISPPLGASYALKVGTRGGQKRVKHGPGPQAALRRKESAHCASPGAS